MLFQEKEKKRKKKAQEKNESKEKKNMIRKTLKGKKKNYWPSKLTLGGQFHPIHEIPERGLFKQLSMATVRKKKKKERKKRAQEKNKSKEKKNMIRKRLKGKKKKKTTDQVNWPLGAVSSHPWNPRTGSFQAVKNCEKEEERGYQRKRGQESKEVRDK